MMLVTYLCIAGHGKYTILLNNSSCSNSSIGVSNYNNSKSFILCWCNTSAKTLYAGKIKIMCMKGVVNCNILKDKKTEFTQ